MYTPQRATVHCSRQIVGLLQLSAASGVLEQSYGGRCRQISARPPTLPCAVSSSISGPPRADALGAQRARNSTCPRRIRPNSNSSSTSTPATTTFCGSWRNWINGCWRCSAGVRGRSNPRRTRPVLEPSCRGCRTRCRKRPKGHPDRDFGRGPCRALEAGYHPPPPEGRVCGGREAGRIRGRGLVVRSAVLIMFAPGTVSKYFWRRSKKRLGPT